MTSLSKRELRAAEYRRLASVAGALAESCSLANVRDCHERAAAQWTALAVMDERPPEPGRSWTQGALDIALAPPVEEALEDQ